MLEKINIKNIGPINNREFILKQNNLIVVNQQDLGNLLIGNGTYSTVRLVGNLAHNDWFELLICNGLLGLCVYLSFWISLFKYKKTLKDPLAYNVINLFFIIFLLKTFFSMSYTSMGIFALMPVAYIMATPQKR